MNEGYKSPIELTMENIKVDFDNEIYKAVLGCGIQVDKVELLKALEYDRDQYEKGYQDGVRNGARFGEWKGLKKGGQWYYFCSECDTCGEPNHRYCHNCGARMDFIKVDAFAPKEIERIKKMRGIKTDEEK